MKNDNEKDHNSIKEKTFFHSNNHLTVVTTSGYKLAKVRLNKNFFENLLVLEMDLEDNFSMEKLFELIKQYSIAIEYYLQNDHIKAKAYQNRMEYLLTNKDTLVQLKRQNDKKNNDNNDNNQNNNNNEKNINNNKIKSSLNIQKEYVKIRQDDINIEDISKKVTKVLNSSNKKSENKISWKNIINNDLEKQNSNWKEKLKAKKKNASRFSVKPSLGGVRKRFMGSANDSNLNSAQNGNNINLDNNPKVSDFKNPFEELYGANENDEKDNNMDIIEEDVEDKKEENKENKENKINDPIKNIIIEEKIKEEEKDIDENKKDVDISQENTNKIEVKEQNENKENQNIENNKIEEKKDENIINENNSDENLKDQKQNEEKKIIIEDKNEIKEEKNEIKEVTNEIKEEKNEIKEEKNEIKEEKNEIVENKNEIKEDKNEIKENQNEIKENQNEIKEDKNEIKEEKKDEAQNQNNNGTSEVPNTQSPFEEPLFSKRKASILEEDIIGKIKPDDEISSSIESLLTSLKNKIIQINAQNTHNEGNNEEEEESEFSNSNTDLTKVKPLNNDLDKIPGKFQGAYLDIQTIMDNYIYDFNQFFYKEIFEQFSSHLKELYEQKYKKYIEIRNEYHAQIKENEYLLELDENLTKEKKEEIQQTIESLNEEQQHQIDVVEDEFNKKISDKISEFKQNTFKHNSGIQLLEEKVKLDIYSLINDAFIN